MKIRTSFNLFNREVGFSLLVRPKRDKFHYGMGNRCSDGRYCLFLDYDETPIEWIREEIDLLHELFDLGHAYIFSTKNGYHVCFLEKYLLSDLLVMMDATTCDSRYKQVPLLYAKKVWVLRQSEKHDENLEYIGIVRKDTVREKSNAHAKWLRAHYNIPDNHLPGFGYDDSVDVYVGYYAVSER